MTQTGELLHTMEGHADFVKSLLVCGDCLVSTSSDKTIRIWDLSSLENETKPISIETYKEHTRPVDSVAVADFEEPTGWLLVLWTGDSMGILREWELKDKKLTHRRVLPGHETSISDLVPVEDGLWSGKSP